jgi:hypothetical protein
MIPVSVKGIAYDASGSPVVLLIDQKEERVLPIWVGPLEAHAIAIALEKTTLPRPLTHDLLKNVCDRLGAQVSQVVISDLLDNTFYSEVHLVLPKEEMILDARPSDAIALALRATSPVFLSDKLTSHMLNIKDLFDEEAQAELQKILHTSEEKEKKLLH